MPVRQTDNPILDPAPEPPSCGLTPALLRENSLQVRGFQAWLFDPAMLYRAGRMWWDDRGPRPRPHEGLDLCLYWRRGLEIARLGPQTRIPAAYAGTVVHLCEDYIGRSVMIAHRFPGLPGQYYTLYGHTRPRASLEAGQPVCAGEVVARLAPVTRPGATALPHLHLSLGWSPEPLAPERLEWDLVPETLRLLDPLPLLLWP